MKPIRFYLPLAAFLFSARVVAADDLNLTNFTAADVGTPALTGTSTLAAGGVDITAGGLDIGGSSDEFHFFYQTCSNDFDVAVRVESLANSDVWAKAGLMARETLDANSDHVSVLASPTLAGCFFETRALAGGVSALLGSFPVNYPQTWLRLQRAGDVFNGYASLDGQKWSLLGSASLTITNPLYFGLAVSSHNTNGLTSARFRDLSYVTNALVGGNPVSPREPLGPSSRKTGLAISEIMYKPAPRTDGKILEYVELFNSNPFFEDVSGYRLSGDIDFTFPADTILGGGAFRVVARSPADIQSVYGITNVSGPYTNSLKRSGVVRLRNDTDAIYLEVPSSNQPPWPVAADGTGHSLVLARPSYGEGFAKAWDISDAVGGSPGAVESYRPGPLRDVVINEFLAHTDDPLLDYIELYNHSNQ